MGKYCSWGRCNSDGRYPERVVGIKFFPFPKPVLEREKCLRWIKACGRPHEQLNIGKINRFRSICSKHFVELVDGKPSPRFPDPLPAVYSTHSRRKISKSRCRSCKGFVHVNSSINGFSLAATSNTCESCLRNINVDLDDSPSSSSLGGLLLKDKGISIDHEEKVFQTKTTLDKLSKDVLRAKQHLKKHAIPYIFPQPTQEKDNMRTLDHKYRATISPQLQQEGRKSSVINQDKKSDLTIPESFPGVAMKIDIDFDDNIMATTRFISNDVPLLPTESGSTRLDTDINNQSQDDSTAVFNQETTLVPSSSFFSQPDFNRHIEDPDIKPEIDKVGRMISNPTSAKHLTGVPVTGSIPLPTEEGKHPTSTPMNIEPSEVVEGITDQVDDSEDTESEDETCNYYSCDLCYMLFKEEDRLKLHVKNEHQLKSATT